MIKDLMCFESTFFFGYIGGLDSWASKLLVQNFENKNKKLEPNWFKN
jgi:hypothetical protein